MAPLAASDRRKAAAGALKLPGVVAVTWRLANETVVSGSQGGLPAVPATLRKHGV